jgi:hypothetical protein
MKKISSAALLLFLLLCCSCGKQQVDGPYGTLETATSSVVYEDAIYFLYPTGPTDTPAGIAKYDLTDKTFQDIVHLPEEDILGLQVLEDQIVFLSKNALYGCALDGSAWETFLQSDDDGPYRNVWFFVWGQNAILCRSTYETAAPGDDVSTEILAVSLSNGKTKVLLQEDTLFFWSASTVCYWEGKLYSRGMLTNEIRALDLSSGEVSTEYAGTQVTQLYADRQGVLYQTAEEDVQLRLGSTSTAAAPAGSLAGCNGDAAFFIKKRGFRGEITKVSVEGTTVLLSDYRWDMVTFPDVYVAGNYVLFYSMDDLTEENESLQAEDGQTHYLYLLDGETLTKIGSYQADYNYS